MKGIRLSDPRTGRLYPSPTPSPVNIPGAHFICRSQRPRGLRRRCVASRLLRLWVRIPPGVCMFVYCECCVLSGRGLCDELITRTEETYRIWCVVVCDLETSWMRSPWPTGGGGLSLQKQKKLISFRGSVYFRVLPSCIKVPTPGNRKAN